MGVEVRALGARCNIRCDYCYQNPERDAEDAPPSYDLALIEEALEREGRPFTLFGGEPLMMPVRDLEALWSFGLRRFGRNAVQTNGTLIGDEHLRLFREYRVHVGISLDGPADLNDARWAGSLEKTRKATERAHAALRRLCRQAMPPSVIVTLHRGNATADRLPRMHAWMRELDALGVRSARLHVLEVDDEAGARLALTPEENLVALRSFLELEPDLPRLRFDLSKDLHGLLSGGDGGATCVWRACDPYTTRAVQGIEGDGQQSNCGRTNKDGVAFVKAAVEGFERYVALHQVPQEHGGCRGCRFFAQCKGQCPGTAIDGDWRNRTEHCETWKALFEDVEARLLADGRIPLSLDPRRPLVERALVDGWRAGRAATIEHVWESMPPDAATDAPSVEHPPPPRTRTAFGLLLLDDVDLPEFTRAAWTSETAARVWGPRIEAVRRAWGELEWRSVAAGLRACASLVLPTHEVEEVRARLSEAGLSLLALDEEVAGAEVPSARSAVVGRPPDLDRFRAAWDAGDDVALGVLLGAPACCTRLLVELAGTHGIDDPTWPVALRTTGRMGPSASEAAGAAARTGDAGPHGARGSNDAAAPAPAPAVLEVAAPPETNLLWRWMGVRAVTHVPCRDDCAPSVAAGRAMLRLGREIGLEREMAWLEEMLRWPAEWSALHGIAEIRTPILKAMARTDVTAETHVVRRLGDAYPDEGAAGVRFPYRPPRSRDRAATAGTSPVLLPMPVLRRRRAATDDPAVPIR